jgi:hypothetical protein
MDAHGECDIVNGIEKLKYCDGYLEHLRSQPTNRHPESKGCFKNDTHFEWQY